MCRGISEQELNGTRQDTDVTSEDILTSATWGSIFGVKDEKLVKTLFGSLVEEYSSLVIAGLDSIAGKTMQIDSYCIPRTIL